MTGFLKFLAAILPTLIQWIKGWGAREERVRIEKEQQEAADAMRADFDQIGNDGRTFPDSVVRLRRRTAKRSGRVPDASTPDGEGGRRA